MKTHPLNLALMLALAGTLAFTGCRKKDADVDTAANAPVDTMPMPVEPAPAPMPSSETISVSGIDLGTSVGGDNRIASPMTTFAGRDTIHASVSTDGSATGSTITTRWVFQDGQVVHEEKKTVTTTGPAVHDFTISKPDGFPVGKYKLEVMVDDTTMQRRDFEVR